MRNCAVDNLFAMVVIRFLSQMRVYTVMVLSDISQSKTPLKDLLSQTT